MKIRINSYFKPSLSRDCYRKYFGTPNPEFWFYVDLVINDLHLPFFCNGSEHLVQLNFDDPSLHGKGCTTRMHFRILHPYTVWRNDVGEFTLIAEDIALTKLGERSFLTFIERVCQSTNVFVSTTFGDRFDKECIESNELKSSFMQTIAL